MARLLYIFDLDGTLADIEHRRPLISGERKNWGAFYEACDEDEPLMPIVRLCNTVAANGADVWIWTGRSNAVREKTELWLRTWVPLFKPHNLRMREDGDFRSDVSLKTEWWEDTLIEDRKRVTCVFEDRTSVVKMWREFGLMCCQVAPGDF